MPNQPNHDPLGEYSYTGAEIALAYNVWRTSPEWTGDKLPNIGDVATVPPYGPIPALLIRNGKRSGSLNAA